MKKRLLLLAIMLFACTAVVEAQKPLVISKETTRITGPLTADGHIDFLKALEQWSYPKELATDENGFRIFTRLFGDVGYGGEPQDRELYRLQLYEKLGLDPNIKPTLTLPAEPWKIIRDFYESKGEDAPRDNMFNNPSIARPWTLEEYPMLADWVRDMDEPLDALAEAIRKPVFAFPILQSPESMESVQPLTSGAAPLSDSRLTRTITIVKNFHTRALYRIGIGDIDGAIDDKLTFYRFGRLFPQKGSRFCKTLGLFSEDMAATIPVGGNPEHLPTEKQIRRLLDGFDALPPRADYNEAIEWERHVALSWVQQLSIDIAQGNELPEGFEMLRGRSLITFDWNVVYRNANELFDAAQEPPPREKLQAIIEALQKEPTTMQRLLMSLEKDVSRRILTMFAVTPERMERRIQQIECSKNMQRLAWAIQLYRFEHKKLPDANWVEQIKPYLGKDAERYFNSPVNPSPKGETTYAMVLYGNSDGDTVAGSPERILLIELTAPVAFDKAIVSPDEILKRTFIGGLSADGQNVACQSGAVYGRFLSGAIDDNVLRRMLGR
jgi:hypothetical protein